MLLGEILPHTLLSATVEFLATTTTSFCRLGPATELRHVVYYLLFSYCSCGVRSYAESVKDIC